MEIGYARISTPMQSLQLQLDALETCSPPVEKVFSEVASGRERERPALSEMLEYAREGDRLTVYSLSRLGRRTVDTLLLIEGLNDRGVHFRSLTEGVDTNSPMGRFQLVLLSALASLEQEVLSERVRAGLASAAARGRKGGRPKALDHNQISDIKRELECGETISGVAKRYNCSRATIYRALVA